jgi:hypothetical protein
MTGLPYKLRNVGTLSDTVTVYTKNATNFEKNKMDLPYFEQKDADE